MVDDLYQKSAFFKIEIIHSIRLSTALPCIQVFCRSHFACEYPFLIHFAAVPQILKDALHVTSQSIEAEMAKTLKIAFEYTGEIVAMWSS